MSCFAIRRHYVVVGGHGLTLPTHVGTKVPPLHPWDTYHCELILKVCVDCYCLSSSIARLLFVVVGVDIGSWCIRGCSACIIQAHSGLTCAEQVAGHSSTVNDKGDE